MTEPIDIQSSEWAEQVEPEDRPVMVEYWHHKCVACKKMKPIYEAQPMIFGDEIKFTRMNLLESKENRRFAIRGGVRSTPSFPASRMSFSAFLSTSLFLGNICGPLLVI